MKKPALIIITICLIGLISLIWLILPKKTPNPVIDNSQSDLPINTIPVSERPFITLTPDKTGHSLSIAVSGAPKSGNMEYEMIYNAAGKQEGALGSLSLASETQPIVKEILLGSRSAGGATTYHEGVTGGSITVTYGETRLKESWNYLHFDPADPTISSTDGKFTLSLNKDGLKKNDVIVTMKTFGLPAPLAGNLVAGPYAFATVSPIKGIYSASLTVPPTAKNPLVYGFVKGAWKKLASRAAGSDLSFDPSGSIAFVLLAD